MIVYGNAQGPMREFAAKQPEPIPRATPVELSRLRADFREKHPNAHEAVLLDERELLAHAEVRERLGVGENALCRALNGSHAIDGHIVRRVLT